jgi:hypothetical protein
MLIRDSMRRRRLLVGFGGIGVSGSLVVVIESRRLACKTCW